MGSHSPLILLTLLVASLPAIARIKHRGNVTSEDDWPALPNELVQYYAREMLDEDTEGDHVSTGDVITIEFYYLATCPRCLSLINLAIRPLVEAQLPGDAVRVVVMPVLKGMSSPHECRETGACRLALAPLCALFRGSRDQPVRWPAPADDPELRRAVQFVSCDIGVTAGDAKQEAATTQACAEQAGFLWEGDGGIKNCVDGQEVFDIIYSPEYARNIIDAMHRLQRADFEHPPSMPWIFFDGALLACGTTECISINDGPSDTSFETPGSLLLLTCLKLKNPIPEACQKVLEGTRLGSRGSERRDATIDVPAVECENCDEVGRYHLSVREQLIAPRWHLEELHMQWWAALAVCMVVTLMVTMRIVIRAQPVQQVAETRSLIL